jgi:hypothetical protein
MNRTVHKAGPLLQVLGLLIFWVASILPFLFTWARFAWWVALAGVVLFLTGLLLQLRAVRQAVDAESLELDRAGQRASIWEFTPQRTVLAFCVALATFVAVSSLWYAAGLHGPLRLAAAQRDAISTLTSIVMPVCFAFVIGVLPGAFALQKTILLTVLLATAGGAVHWGAARLGIQVDWSTGQGSMMLAFLKVLFMLPLTMLGFVVGKTVGHMAGRAGRRRRQHS